MAASSVTINALAYTMTYTLDSAAAPVVTALVLTSDSSDHLNQLKNSDEFLAKVAILGELNRTPGVGPQGLGHKLIS